MSANNRDDGSMSEESETDSLKAAPSSAVSIPSAAIRIDRPTDSIIVKNATSLKLTNNVTFSVWLHPTGSSWDASTPANPINNDRGLSLAMLVVGAYALSCKNGCIKVAFKNKVPGWNWMSTGIRIPPNKWTHIAVTYSADDMTAYVFKDGVLGKALPVEGTLKAGGHTLTVKQLREKQGAPGMPEDDEDDIFVGMIAHLKIFKTVLSESQIISEMSLAPTSHEDDGPGSADANLVGWWKFDEGYGTTVWDATQNAPAGNMTGASWWVGPNAVGYYAVPGSTLITELRQLFDSPIGSDVSLTTEDHPGVPLRAHRMMLAARSETFKAMLLTGMAESSKDEIMIKDISSSTLSLLVEYLYTDTVSLTDQNVVDLFVASDRFQVLRLKAMCEGFLFRHINEDSVCQVLELADRLHASQLRQFCISWILSNFGDMLKTDGYLNLSKDLQQQINHAAAYRYFTKRRRLDPSATN